MAQHACRAEKTAIYIQTPTEQLCHKNIDSTSTWNRRRGWLKDSVWPTGIYKVLGKRLTNAHVQKTHMTALSRQPAAPILNCHLFPSECNKSHVWWCPCPRHLDFCLMADVYIFFFFPHRINWTLSSQLMCSQGLLDLNQLYRSRVRTTGTVDGRSEKNWGRKAAPQEGWEELPGRQHPICFGNSDLKLKSGSEQPWERSRESGERGWMEGSEQKVDWQTAQRRPIHLHTFPVCKQAIRSNYTAHPT